jgi:hypothetical protein
MGKRTYFIGIDAPIISLAISKADLKAPGNSMDKKFVTDFTVTKIHYMKVCYKILEGFVVILFRRKE